MNKLTRVAMRVLLPAAAAAAVIGGAAGAAGAAPDVPAASQSVQPRQAGSLLGSIPIIGGMLGGGGGGGGLPLPI
ncbi:hypothetical protein GCM10023192_42240 [Amycolatopsis samaneae]